SFRHQTGQEPRRVCVEIGGGDPHHGGLPKPRAQCPESPLSLVLLASPKPGPRIRPSSRDILYPMIEHSAVYVRERLQVAKKGHTRLQTGVFCPGPCFEIA